MVSDRLQQVINAGESGIKSLTGALSRQVGRNPGDLRDRLVVGNQLRTITLMKISDDLASERPIQTKEIAGSPAI